MASKIILITDRKVNVSGPGIFDLRLFEIGKKVLPHLMTIADLLNSFNANIVLIVKNRTTVIRRERLFDNYRLYSDKIPGLDNLSDADISKEISENLIDSLGDV